MSRLRVCQPNEAICWTEGDSGGGAVSPRVGLKAASDRGGSLYRRRNERSGEPQQHGPVTSQLQADDVTTRGANNSSKSLVR